MQLIHRPSIADFACKSTGKPGSKELENVPFQPVPTEDGYGDLAREIKEPLTLGCERLAGGVIVVGSHIHLLQVVARSIHLHVTLPQMLSPPKNVTIAPMNNPRIKHSIDKVMRDTLCLLERRKTEKPTAATRSRLTHIQTFIHSYLSRGEGQFRPPASR